MGRKLGNGEANRILSFSLKPKDKIILNFSTLNTKEEIDTMELVRRINEIAERERIPRSELLKRAITSYVELHWQGNYQTLLPSFESDGLQSLGQSERLCYNYFKRHSRVSKEELIYWLMDNDVDPRKRMELATRVSKALTDIGVEIIVKAR